MTSPYLLQPRRTVEEVNAAHERKRHIETLTEMMTHLRNVATMHENSTQNWREAELPNRQAAALKWVLDQLEGGE